MGDATCSAIITIVGAVILGGLLADAADCQIPGSAASVPQLKSNGNWHWLNTPHPQGGWSALVTTSNQTVAWESAMAVQSFLLWCGTFITLSDVYKRLSALDAPDATSSVVLSMGYDVITLNSTVTTLRDFVQTAVAQLQPTLVTTRTGTYLAVGYLESVPTGLLCLNTSTAIVEQCDSVLTQSSNVLSAVSVRASAADAWVVVNPVAFDVPKSLQPTCASPITYSASFYVTPTRVPVNESYIWTVQRWIGLNDIDFTWLIQRTNATQTILDSAIPYAAVSYRVAEPLGVVGGVLWTGNITIIDRTGHVINPLAWTVIAAVVVLLSVAFFLVMYIGGRAVMPPTSSRPPTSVRNDSVDSAVMASHKYESYGATA